MRTHYRASTPLFTLHGRSGIQVRLTPTTGVASNRINTSQCAARRSNLFMVPHGFRLVRRPSSLVHRTAAAHLRSSPTTSHTFVRTPLRLDPTPTPPPHSADVSKKSTRPGSLSASSYSPKGQSSTTSQDSGTHNTRAGCACLLNVVNLLLLPVYFYYFYYSPPLSAGSLASVLSPFAHSFVSRYRTAAARAPPSPSRRRLRSQHPIHHCASLDVLTNLRTHARPTVL
jgi:hypothetical protein